MSRRFFCWAAVACGSVFASNAVALDEEAGCCFEAEQPASDEPSFLVPLDLDLCGYLTFKPGLRIQTRYLHDDDGCDNDIFVRRFRMKGSGEAFGLAKYGAELKIDSTARYCSDPKGRVENAWVEFPVKDWPLNVRVGLYDVPFSRDALTSDSKLLFMDRSLAKGALASLGLADNGIGVLLHGRPKEGKFEYAIGLFDNEKFEKIGADGERRSKWLMPVGRFVINFLDPSKPAGYGDYKGSYLCDGKRLNLGVNGAWLKDAIDDDEKFNIYAWGVDAFFNMECFTCQGEFDWFTRRMHDDDDDNITGYTWYAQAGYMFFKCVELAVRYQDLDPDCHEGDERSRFWDIGMNVYFREHNLKLQTDYSIRSEKGDDKKNHHVFETQLQLDF